MINKLDEKTIKLIVAGEVYVRPTNILKELVDNALDASANVVRISVVDGGYKSLSITDNGHGIQHVDRTKLCKRFCTSKIRTHSELRELRSFGFRGEALALLSHTADLLISSRHQFEEIGWACQFRDGEITSDIRIARDVGTTVTATNVFRRHSQRRHVGVDVGQERAAAAALITDLAVQFSDVSFSLTANEKESLLATHAEPDRSLKSRQTQIKRLYGSRIAVGLVLVSAKSDALGVEALMSPLQSEGSNARMVANFTCFVNDRLVQWSALKRAVRLLYQESSPKDRLVFVHLDVHMPQALIDPNVDPSKAMFVCKDEAQVVQWISDAIRTQQEATHTPLTTTVVARTSKRPTEKIGAEELFNLLSSFTEVPLNMLRGSEMIGAIVCGLYLVAIEDQLVILDLRSFLARMLDAEIRGLDGVKPGLLHDFAKLSPPLTSKALSSLLPELDQSQIRRNLQDPAFRLMLSGVESLEIVQIPFLLELPSIAEFVEAIEQTQFRIPSLGALMVVVSSRKRKSRMKQATDERVWHYLMTKMSSETIQWVTTKETNLCMEVVPANCVVARVVVGLHSLLSAFERC